MNAMIYEEIKEFEKKNQWATGLNIDEERRGFYYDNAEANCIELKFPDTPMRVPYFTRVLSLLNTDSEELFNGALLWRTLWNIGSPHWKKLDGSWLKKCD